METEFEANGGMNSPNTIVLSVRGGQRDQTIDLIKGIGIVLMVLRHAQTPYTHFVSLFHMAIFFMASGYLYSNKNASSIKAEWKYFLRKLKSLYFPCVTFTIIFILLRNVFIDINIYTDNSLFLNAEGLISQYVALTEKYSVSETVTQCIKAFFFRGESPQMGGALWFLRTLFLVLIAYNIAEFILEHISKKHVLLLQTIVAVVSLMIGYFCYLAGEELGGLNRVFSVYILIHFGVLIKKFHVMDYLKKDWHYVVGIAISIVIIMVGRNYGSIGIVSNKIENPVFFVLMSCAGWTLLWCVSKELIRFKMPFNFCLEYLSKYAVWIVGLHFLSFKIVNYIVVIVYGMDWYMAAGFPVNILTGGWWILYTIAGLCIPLLIRIPVVWCRDKVVGLAKSRLVGITR